MAKTVYQATHQGDVQFSDDIKINSAVLDDPNRTRVFSQRSLANAFGIKGGGAYWKKKKELENEGSAYLPEYLSANYLRPYISVDLEQKLNSAYYYISKSGVEANGVMAAVLSDICDVYIKAYNDGHESLKEVSEKAYSIIKALSKVAVIALVDEATGYMWDKKRSKDVLQQFFKKFLRDEAAKWVKTFSDDFFEMIFRMRGWDWTDLNKRPGIVGKYINDIVYERIAPGVLDELRVKNPANQKGNRTKRHHQYLTTDYGHPKLKEHLEAVMALGRASGFDWDLFMTMLNKAYPKYGHTLSLEFPEDYASDGQESSFDVKLKTAFNFNPNKK